MQLHASQPGLLRFPAPRMHLVSWSAFSPAPSGSCLTCGVILSWSLYPPCPLWQPPQTYCVTFTNSLRSRGVFFISGPAHSGCTFKFFCIHTPTSPKVEALQKLHRFVPISQDNLNFKTVWPDCEVMCSFQFGFRKHDCHFYSNHESRFGDYLFHLSWFQFTWMRSARRGTGSGRFCPCACEAQDIRKAFKKITYCV